MPWNRLERLVRRDYQRFFLLALSVTGNRAMAEDAVHDAIVAVAEAPDRPLKLGPYLAASVRNRALRLVQLQSRDFPEATAPVAFCTSPSPELEALTHQINRAMRVLSFDERETVCLHLYGGMRFREIADYRDVPLGTVTSWYRRALTKLNNEVNDDNEDRKPASLSEPRRA